MGESCSEFNKKFNARTYFQNDIYRNEGSAFEEYFNLPCGLKS